MPNSCLYRLSTQSSMATPMLDRKLSVASEDSLVFIDSQGWSQQAVGGVADSSAEEDAADVDVSQFIESSVNRHRTLSYFVYQMESVQHPDHASVGSRSRSFLTTQLHLESAATQ
eukprot:GILJ01008569.1.p1 GENE.GILJ01008569.1~~GILJ01008569.1.p1  ORF type:complete len:115 (+),score=15.37 GILJ01008569.1:194-538(+)